MPPETLRRRGNSVSNRCEDHIKTNNDNLTERAAVASRLSEISKAIPDAPDIDRRKVESVREALARGAYRVDPGRIADKLIQMEEALRSVGERGLDRTHAGRTGSATR